jgi:hypothetical protein
MDKKNSWTCPEIFRSIGKKKLPGSNGLTVILLLERLHKLFLSEFLYSYAGNVSNDVADA